MAQHGTCRDPVCITRVYLEGAFGIGKTTTALAFVNGSRVNPVFFIGEPMMYWRNMAGDDAINGIYGTQVRRKNGEISDNDAQRLTAYFQGLFCSPHSMLHARILHLTVQNPNNLALKFFNNPVAIFDRHPVASNVCFPISRYVVGDMTPATLPGFLFAVSEEPEGTNLIVCTVSLTNHLTRITNRSRSGEIIDVQFILVLRNVYIMLINTIRYLQAKSDWLIDWFKLPFCSNSFKQQLQEKECITIQENPVIENTLFAVFKIPELCDSYGELLDLWKWGMGVLANRLKNISCYVLSLDTTPTDAVIELCKQLPNMTVSYLVPGGLAYLQEMSDSVNL
ncbi:thymidine kinase [Cercopithecine alphaherpesvirus 9]|uniref:Thymidine kinase n=2 Tax=Cercopithecine alphaherpesvirus 9 TaxID=35246 RepID=A0A2D0TCK7_CHV9D|nr:thymidine kinase [Cercopithecine alphaherpesvirus 9]AAB04138.1 thymidine kinase [Cercopithecine alphaherpesvirus 9]AAG27210.1 thymidine kinase [Cercopithecine alphaherpesvirus 9]